MSDVTRGRSVERRARTQVDQSPSPPRTKDFASKQGLEGPSEEENPERPDRAIISTAEKYIDKFLGYAEKHPESLTAALKAKGENEEEFRGRLSRAKKWVENYKAGKITDQNEVDNRLTILSRGNDKHFPELEEKVQEVLTISTAEKYIDKFLGYAEKYPDSLAAARKAGEKNQKKFMERLTDAKKWIEDYNAGKIDSGIDEYFTVLRQDNELFPELDQQVKREVKQEKLTAKWDQAILQKQDVQMELTVDWLSGARTLSDRENDDIRSYMKYVNDRISELARLNQQDKSETSEIAMQNHLFQIDEALSEVKSTLDPEQEREGSITPRMTDTNLQSG